MRAKDAASRRGVTFCRFGDSGEGETLRLSIRGFALVTADNVTNFGI